MSIIEAASALLERVEERLRLGWCQGSSGRDAEGNPVRADSPKAVKWCLSGALALEGSLFVKEHEGDDTAYESYKIAACALTDETLDYGSRESYNDAAGRQLADVLLLVRCAIERLRRTQEGANP